MIKTFHVYKDYGARNALEDVNISIGQGEFVFACGPSGAGKTTLLRLLYLGERPTRGDILIDGVNLHRVKRKKLPFFRRKIGVVFQDFKLIRTQTVFQNLALPLEVSGHKKNHIRQKVCHVLRVIGLENRMNSFPASLSGGEQQRIAIARAVVHDPLILLADEPTGNLDDRSAEIVLDLLNELNLKGTTVLLATHDRELVSRSGNQVIFLNNGRIKD
jgi:cell division transport system ATP-binding protein